MTVKQKIKLIIGFYKNQVRDKDGFLRAAGMNFYMSEKTIQQAWLSTGAIPERKVDNMLSFTADFIADENRESEKLIKKYVKRTV